LHLYITAGCTDGKTYVWDTAQGDLPIHALAHGEIMEETAGTMSSVEDNGVKFTAWGTTLDRFYTGSSDGVVKVWNVRTPATYRRHGKMKSKGPLVRDLLECTSCVSFGAFSPDFSKLAIGDASGSVFLLTVDEEDECAERSLMLFKKLTTADGRTRYVRRPTPCLPFKEPPPPDGISGPEAQSLRTGIDAAQEFILTGQLVPGPFGPVKGRFYAETNLYRRDWHFQSNPLNPLLAQYEELQRDNNKMYGTEQHLVLGTVTAASVEATKRLHTANMQRDLDVEALLEDLTIEPKLEPAEVEPDLVIDEYEEFPAEFDGWEDKSDIDDNLEESSDSADSLGDAMDMA